MNKIAICLALLIVFTFKVNAQSKETTSKYETEINIMVNTFMDCLIKKDSVTFFNLFNENPVTWVHVSKENTAQNSASTGNTIKNDYYDEDYKKFYRYITTLKFTKQKNYNITINQDDYTASVTFDYSFWKGRKKKIWGNESWGLIYKNRSWKITRVVYNLSFENTNPEPIVK